MAYDAGERRAELVLLLGDGRKYPSVHLFPCRPVLPGNRPGREPDKLLNECVMEWKEWDPVVQEIGHQPGQYFHFSVRSSHGHASA
jgi:hypothetical protein